LRKIIWGFLLLAQLGAVEYSLPAPQRVEIPAERLTIIGTYYPAPATGSSAVILIHGLGRNRGDWNDLAKYLQKEGISALSVDLRGHGESIGEDGLGWRAFTEPDYKILLADLNAVLSFAGRNFNVKPGRTGLIGQGLGANLVMQLAERNPQVAGVVLLSPALDYKGVKLTAAKYQKSIYIICSHFEKLAVEADEYLKSNFKGKLKSDVYDYGGTIISMFRQKFTLPANISVWFKQLFAN
jgi:pimeloyl-ACP methyl ester carboxylesterase